MWTEEHEKAANIVAGRAWKLNYRHRYGLEVEDIGQLVKLQMFRYMDKFPPYLAAEMVRRRIPQLLRMNWRKRDQRATEINITEVNFDDEVSTRTPWTIPTVSVRGVPDVTLTMIARGYTTYDVDRHLGRKRDSTAYQLKLHRKTAYEIVHEVVRCDETPSTGA